MIHHTIFTVECHSGFSLCFVENNTAITNNYFIECYRFAVYLQNSYFCTVANSLSSWVFDNSLLRGWEGGGELDRLLNA